MIKKVIIGFAFLVILLSWHEEIFIINIDALKSSLWSIVKWVAYVFGTYLAHYLISHSPNS